jgi:hypothetical protein
MYYLLWGHILTASDQQLYVNPDMYKAHKPKDSKGREDKA